MAQSWPEYIDPSECSWCSFFLWYYPVLIYGYHCWYKVTVSKNCGAFPFRVKQCMKGEGTLQLSGHCTLQKMWFKWLAVTLFLADDCSGHSLTLTSHCMLRMVSISRTGLKALQYQWIVLLSVSMWTRITHAVLALYILTSLLVQSICSLLMCLQQYIVLCCWIGGLYWVLCERACDMSAVLKRHISITHIGLNIVIVPPGENRKTKLLKCVSVLLHVKEGRILFSTELRLELYLFDLRHIMFHEVLCELWFSGFLFGGVGCVCVS
jgi:hypothetical protein